MRWRANLPTACWLIWVCPSPTPFAGRADGSITWPPRKNRPHANIIGILRLGFQCREPKVRVPRCPLDMYGWGDRFLFSVWPRFPKLRSRCDSVECGKFLEGEFMFRRWCIGIAGLVFMVAAADGQNPLAGDAKAAKAGEYEFRINCALCHGLGAHGGGRGPDLTRAVKKHTHSDADMFQVISNGIPGTAMPANG